MFKVKLFDNNLSSDRSQVRVVALGAKDSLHCNF